MHCHTTWGPWAVKLLQCSASLPGLGSGTPATHCHTAWGLWAVENPATHCHATGGEWVVQLLQRTSPPSWGSGKCNSCHALPHCPVAPGSGTPATQRPAPSGQWAVQLLQYISSLLWGQWVVQLLQRTTPPSWGSGKCNSCHAPPHCLMALGIGTSPLQCLAIWGQWAVELVQRSASLPRGTGQGNS